MKNERKDILDVLGDLDHGRAADKISRELRNVTTACNERQVKGNLTIKIIVEPTGPGSCRMLAAIKSNRPGPPLEAQPYDVTEEGDLRTQLTLPVIEMGPPRGRRRSTGDA